MLTICEGLDKCGKSTFIKNFKTPILEALGTWGADITKPLPGYQSYAPLSVLSFLERCKDDLQPTVALHFDSSDKKPFESFMRCLNIAENTHLLLDRSFISEIVYGRVFRGMSRISLQEEQEIINELRNVPHQILYFRRKLDTAYFEELDKNDQFECNQELILKLNDEFNRVMRSYSKAGLNVYEISFNIKRS